jgi:tRNA dimethylallyltransferase
MNSLICIVGPTGIGKTRTAAQISCVFPSEVINCDSRQVYRYMDIGTAKPIGAELSFVKHHLIEVHSRGILPLLVGGTGQYFWAVIEGWQTPKVPPDSELRRNLEEQAIEKGASGLYDELMAVDPVAARKIDPHNVRRIVRALEVFRIGGVPFSKLQYKKPPEYRILIIGLTAERQQLYRMVDERVDRMIENGLVTEVKKLIEMGYSEKLPSLSGIGYRQICQYLKSELTLEEAVQRIKFETHRYIRQQYAWFHLKDERIHWFNIYENGESNIIDLIEGFIEMRRDNRNI